MTESKPRKNRRKALQDIAGVGAVAGMLPLLGRLLDDQSPMSLFPAAFAQGINSGVRMGQGRGVFVSGAQTQAVSMAEWEPPANADRGAETGGLRIAQGDAAVAKAPANASRYNAKAFDFPGGTLRVLIWKKGGPVMHQITYETEIMVLEGSVTLAPAHGIAGPTVTLHRGDALYLPSGVLSNMKPTSDTVLLQAFVHSSTDKSKRSVVLAKNAQETVTAEWIADGKPMRATGKDLAKAPKGASRLTVKRYSFDGNSFRWARLVKGSKTNPVTPTRSDVIMYITKGRMRRTAGDQTFEVVAGDAVREATGAQGSWEVLEDSEFISTDAPVRPGVFSPGMVSAGGGLKLFAMNIDENGRSHLGFADMAMKKLSATESLSEKQPGLNWRVGPRAFISAYARTSKSYTSNTGPYELHTGGPPHFTGCMAGHVETTFQDGGVLRRAAGEFCYITPGAMHHSNFKSDVPAVYFNLYVPGSEDDTRAPVFK